MIKQPFDENLWVNIQIYFLSIPNLKENVWLYLATDAKNETIFVFKKNKFTQI
jgi:hypothetical protein